MEAATIGIEGRKLGLTGKEINDAEQSVFTPSTYANNHANDGQKNAGASKTGSGHNTASSSAKGHDMLNLYYLYWWVSPGCVR